MSGVWIDTNKAVLSAMQLRLLFPYRSVDLQKGEVGAAAYHKKVVAGIKSKFTGSESIVTLDLRLVFLKLKMPTTFAYL